MEKRTAQKLTAEFVRYLDDWTVEFNVYSDELGLLGKYTGSSYEGGIAWARKEALQEAYFDQI